MESIVINGVIQTTSNKTDGKFKQDDPTKTAYLEVVGEDAKLLEDFGVRKYTSKQDGNDFFIVKTSRNIAIYVAGVDEMEPEIMDGGVQSANFKTKEEKPLKLNIIKGENLGREFYRLQAIQIQDHADIQKIEAQNPFA